MAKWAEKQTGNERKIVSVLENRSIEIAPAKKDKEKN